MNQEIVIPIFNSEYKVIVCWGELNYVAKVLRDWHHDLGGVRDELAKELRDRRGITVFQKDCNPVIVLPRYPRTPTEIGTLAHEATHAIKNIFEKLGEESSDEIYSHCVGAVVRETLLNIKRR